MQFPYLRLHGSGCEGRARNTWIDPQAFALATSAIACLRKEDKDHKEDREQFV